MSEKITIGVDLTLTDNVSAPAEKATKTIENLDRKTAKPKVDAEDSKFTKKMRVAEAMADKFKGTKASKTLEAYDKASKKIEKATSLAKKFGRSTFRATVGIVNKATAPLRMIRNALFNLKTLAAGIVVGLGIRKAVGFMQQAIGTADAYTGVKIAFQTQLGEERAKKMMDDMDAFAKKTPFKTSNTVEAARKMMAYGWDANRVLTDMETIGNAAAATGKGDQGLQSIVYALSEIRSKGKLSTQELNQLASAGIKAKAYLAQGMGYGTSDAGMKKLSKDLESGAIGANRAIDMILQGMKEFDGMMDATANSTVGGLMSQLEDVYEINMQRRFGQGLQEGATRGISKIIKLLDDSEDKLEKFGDLLFNIGKQISNWGADKIERTVTRIQKVMDSDLFKKASTSGKIKMLWDEVVAKPLGEWWDTTGREKVTETAINIGETIAKGVVSGAKQVIEDHPIIGAMLGLYAGGKAIKGAASLYSAIGTLGAAGMGGIGAKGLSSAADPTTAGWEALRQANGVGAAAGGIGLATAGATAALAATAGYILYKNIQGGSEQWSRESLDRHGRRRDHRAGSYGGHGKAYVKKTTVSEETMAGIKKMSPDVSGFKAEAAKEEMRALRAIEESKRREEKLANTNETLKSSNEILAERGSAIVSSIGMLGSKIDANTVALQNFRPGGRGRRAMYTGGIATRITDATIGERGPEAVVPISRSMRGRAIEILEKAGLLGKRGSVELEGGLKARPGAGGSARTIGKIGGANVSLGGVNITVSGGKNSDEVVSAIRDNLEGIAEDVARVINAGLSGNFDNMPTLKGV